MAASIQPKRYAYAPYADLSASQYCFVKQTDDRTVNVCSADDNAVGILQNAPILRDVADVARQGGGGLLKVGSGQTVAAGDYLRADSSAAGKVVTTGKANARAEQSGVAGDIIAVIVEDIFLG